MSKIEQEVGMLERGALTGLCPDPHSKEMEMVGGIDERQAKWQKRDNKQCILDEQAFVLMN